MYHKDKVKDKAAFIIVKSNRSTTQQAVTQDSNDRPNKLSRRTATRSQTRPVCNKWITQFLPATHTRTIVSVLPSHKARMDLWTIVRNKPLDDDGVDDDDDDDFVSAIFMHHFPNYVKCPCNNFIKRHYNQYFVNNQIWVEFQELLWDNWYVVIGDFEWR